MGSALARAQEGTVAESVIAARTLGYAGIEAYQNGDYLLADEKLGRAYRVLPVPSLGLWSARALVKLNLLVAASQRYAEVTSSRLEAGDPAIQREARRDAERELAELLPQIPSVTLKLAGAAPDEVEVTINGVRIETKALATPILVDPGERRIEGKRGSQRVQLRLVLLPRQQGSALLDFRPKADAAAAATIAAGPLPTLGLGSGDVAGLHRAAAEDGGRRTWRTVGWSAVAVGGSVLALSGVAGLIAWNQKGELDCSRHPCRSSDPDQVESYNGWVQASTIGYISGALIAGGGLVLLLRYPELDTDLTLGVGPGTARLTGHF